MANTNVYPFGQNGTLPLGSAIVNDLTTGGVNKALSAEQGKTLKGLVDAMQTRRTVVSTGSALTADTLLDLGTTDTVEPTLPASYTDADEFIFMFTCDTASCSVTLPSGVELSDNCDDFSEIAAGVTFLVSIMADMAAYLCFTPTNNS